MAKLNTGSATMDKNFEIKKADESFYKYVGEDNFVSLVKSAHPADFSRLTEAVEELKKDGHSMVAYRIQRADGKYRWVLAELEYDTVEFNGEPLINICIQDIQDLEREMNDIKSANIEFGEFMGLLDEIFFIYNIEEDHLNVFYGGNKQKISLINSKIDEWISQVIDKEFVPEKDINIFDSFCRDLKSGKRSFRYEMHSREFSENGALKLLLIKGKTIRDAFRERSVIGCITIVSEQTKKKEINYDSEFNKDAATDILNKRTITSYAKKVIDSNSENKVHLCIIDLDNFKNINDTFGHMFGDEVLYTAAEILKEAVGDKGMVGRIGGDEMMIVLDKVQTHAELRGILRSIRSNIEYAYKGKKEGVNLTSSIGVASYPAHAQNYDDLFKIADKMLYRAKNNGKNRYVIYTPEIHGNVLEEAETENKSYSKPVDKEALMLRIIDDFLYRQITPYQVVLEEVAEAFGLETIDIYYDNLKRPYIEWNNESDHDNKSMEYVKKDNFSELFNANGVARIDYISNIEVTYPAAYQYMKSRNIVTAVIYRMNESKKDGYVVYYKTSDSSRKWSDKDLSYLNMIGRILELSIGDR